MLKKLFLTLRLVRQYNSSKFWHLLKIIIFDRFEINKWKLSILPILLHSAKKNIYLPQFVPKLYLNMFASKLLNGKGNACSRN